MTLAARYRQVVGSSRPRPFLRARLAVGQRRTPHVDVLVDTGSVVTVFSADLLRVLGLHQHDIQWTGADGRERVLVWRGTDYRRGEALVELSLEDDRGNSLAWETSVSFTEAPLPYALLGDRGGLEFLDALFQTRDQVIELHPNWSFQGKSSSAGR